MQIFAPTAIFEPRRNEKNEVMYWPKNDFAKQLGYYAGRHCDTVDQIAEIKLMGINVELVNVEYDLPSALDYDALADHSRKMAAYKRQRQVMPKHIMDDA